MSTFEPCMKHTGANVITTFGGAEIWANMLKSHASKFNALPVAASTIVVIGTMVICCCYYSRKTGSPDLGNPAQVDALRRSKAGVPVTGPGKMDWDNN